ncbi:MAG: extracellular solute-binding protein [bacterium]
MASCLALVPAAVAAAPTHGVAMHGDLKYPADFEHFDYAQPTAPKGGTFKTAALGTFDSFNPFLVRGNPASGLGRLWDTLTTQSADEPFSEYGLLAETIEIAEDHSEATFVLRENARWHDGQPITPEDVIWSFETLRDKGAPFYRAYYAGVTSVEKVGERGIHFSFASGGNPELPIIIGQLPVLPKHWWATRDFSKTSLEPPLGSGPYRIESFEAGRRIRFARVENYWGKDLAVNRGRHNADFLEVDYYRDGTVALEAFKAGEYDFRPENMSKAWATGYDIPAVKTGELIRKEVPHGRPSGMQAFVMNTRRDKFRDARVRRALGELFDFEWSNAALFYGQYTRTRSFFDNSELAATGLPGAKELEVLEKVRGKVPAEVFTRAYEPPATDGSGNIRTNLKAAHTLLAAAGWKVNKKTRKLTNTATGKVMRFEILLVTPEFERVVLPFKKNLERLGIDATVRTVDAAQYRRRLDEFDFDIVVGNFPQSLSPGNEQRDLWGAAYADQKGSRNWIGMKDEAVDYLVEEIIHAPTREDLVARTKALDRVLQWGHWVIPQWHIAHDRIAWWNKFGMPAIVPLLGVQTDTWWIDPARQAALDGAGKP